MASSTEIEWTDATWNPVTGCTKITRGCDLCYAERFSERFRGVRGHPFENGFDLKLRPERLAQPLTWRQPRRIFVNSMSDLFHKDVPRPFIDSIFDTMEAADWHTFQVLTKRSSLMVRYLRDRYGAGKAPSHIWLGVSVEDAKNAIRLKHLSAAQASVKFVSFEPLIGPVGKVDFKGIDWAIVGGESGPHARPMKEEWAIEIRDQCKSAKVAFFFKQWGGVRPKSGGRLLRGREWDQYALNKIGPLFDRPKCEVLINFMYDFVNRAASMSDAKTIASLDPILGGPEWEIRLDPNLPRGRAVEKLFRDNLATVGRFDFVVSTKIDRPTADRPHFFIAYGTKSRDGLKVFREAEYICIDLARIGEIEQTWSGSSRKPRDQDTIKLKLN